MSDSTGKETRARSERRAGTVLVGSASGGMNGGIFVDGDWGVERWE